MTLNAAIEAELPYLRAEAEARMTSTATIYRRTSRTTQDEDTGIEVPVWDVVAADVPFRLGGANTGSSGTRTENIGGADVQTAIRVGHLPASTDDLQDGDWIDVLTGENAGTAWSIVEVTWQDQATARRMPLLAEQRPDEWPN